MLAQTLTGYVKQGARLAESTNDGPAYWTGDKLSLVGTNGTSPNRAIGSVANVTKLPSPNDSFVIDATRDVNGMRTTATFTNQYVSDTYDLTEFSVSANPVHADDRVLWLQDTRDWYSIHEGSANMAFADGSVKPVTDINGDRYFNPGFPAWTGTEASDGYTSGHVELPQYIAFSAAFLTSKTITKSSHGEE